MERGRDAGRASGQRRHAADERNSKANRDLPRKAGNKETFLEGDRERQGGTSSWGRKACWWGIFHEFQVRPL